MKEEISPTERELEILRILWERGEASVRQVYEELREKLPIVQNTIQAFLRKMEEKKQVTHRVEGRTFVYKPLIQKEITHGKLASRLLQRVFHGSIDQLVHSIFQEHRPSEKELRQLESLIEDMKSSCRTTYPGRPIDQSTGWLARSRSLFALGMYGTFGSGNAGDEDFQESDFAPTCGGGHRSCNGDLPRSGLYSPQSAIEGLDRIGIFKTRSEFPISQTSRFHSASGEDGSAAQCRADIRYRESRTHVQSLSRPQSHETG